MKTEHHHIAQMCNHEVQCPNCGSWLAFPWWLFATGGAGRCGVCKSYHKDVNSLKGRSRREHLPEADNGSDRPVSG